MALNRVRVLVATASWAIVLIAAILVEAKALAVVLTLALPAMAIALMYGVKPAKQPWSQRRNAALATAAVVTGLVGAAMWLIIGPLLGFQPK
jgi:hypothetical protein